MTAAIFVYLAGLLLTPYVAKLAFRDFWDKRLSKSDLEAARIVLACTSLIWPVALLAVLVVKWVDASFRLADLTAGRATKSGREA